MRSWLKGLFCGVWMVVHTLVLAEPTAPLNPLSAYDGAKLGSVVGVVPTLDITHRHLHLTGTQVRVAPVVGDGKTLGFYFKGRVQVQYVTENSLEFPRFEYNLQGCTKVKVLTDTHKRSLVDEVGEGIVWSSGAETTLLAGLKGDAPTPEMEGAFHAFKIRNEQGGVKSVGFDLSMLGQTGEPFAVEMLGDQRWLYQDDSNGAAEESLILLMGFKNKNLKEEAELRYMLQTVMISRQRNDRGWKQLDRPPFLLTHVGMDLKAFKNDRVTLKVEETILPLKAGLQTMQMDLYSNILSYNGTGLKNRHLNLLSVKDDVGRSIPFAHREDQLFLRMPEAMAANQPLKLTFEIEGDFLIRWSEDNKWDLRPGAWFPQPELNGQFYTVDARIAVQKPFVPCASADTVSRSEEGDFNVLVARCDKPIQFFSVTAGNYKLTEQTRNGRTVRVANYAMVNDQTPRVIGLTFDVIDFYETILGPFPFKELTIVEQNEWGYGQAPPGLIYITKEAFNQTFSGANRFFSKGINARFAHEIAHMYWGHQVKMPSSEEQWITEAFSEYSSALFMARASGKKYYDGMLNEWWNGAKESHGFNTIPFANETFSDFDPVESSKTRYQLIYYKGAYLLHDLHEQVGHPVFVTFFRSAQASFKWKFATTENLAGLLKVVAKKDFSDYIAQNYWGLGLPELKK